ncbi:MAG: flotillin family protein [Thiolinea sp.]
MAVLDNSVILAGVTALIVIVIIVALFSAFYRRSTKDRAFVRTGFGGELVVMNSGALVLPVLHDMMTINMQTMRVEVERSNHDALITHDSLRVDVVAEFFLRVAQNRDAISTAARTLGERTMSQERMKEIVEAQCVAALRSVASSMSLDELHVKRADFEKNVEDNLNTEFQKNGLELVSVSLMRLDQTAREYLDENNAFDARGLIKLDEITEESRKRRNDIEQENKIKIQEKNKESEQRRLQIEQQQVESQKQQERYLADLQAQTAKDIEENKLRVDRELEEIRIAKDTSIEMAKRDMEVARAEFEKGIAEAWMATDKMKAEAARLTEEIATAREKAEAERKKILEIIGAQREAQRQTIIAEANAEVERLAAKAAEIRYQVEAIGKRTLNEAANILGQSQIDMQVKMEIVRQLPLIIRESVKPIENIDGIKIMHIDGFGAVTGSSAGVNGNGSNSGLADQIVDSALRYRAQVPLIDSLLREVDLKGDTSDGLTGFIREQIAPERSKRPSNERLDDAEDKPDAA